MENNNNSEKTFGERVAEQLAIQEQEGKKSDASDAQPPADQTSNQTQPPSDTTTQATSTDATPADDAWWTSPDKTSVPTESIDDYKRQIAEYRAREESLKNAVGRYEKHEIVKHIAETLEHPDADLDKIFDSYRPKDITGLTTEELFKMNLQKDSTVEYSEKELNRAWVKKEKEIREASDDDEDFSLEVKNLRKGLLTDLKPKIKATDEPDYIKNTKEAVRQRREQQQIESDNQRRFLEATHTFADSLVGKKFGEVEITKDDIDTFRKTLSWDYYKDETGNISEKKLTIERLKAIKFDALFASMRKDVEAEIKQKVANPSENNSNKGGNLPTDSRTDQEKMVDGYFKDTPAPRQKVIFDN